jgi:hypothetical protein
MALLILPCNTISSPFFRAALGSLSATQEKFIHLGISYADAKNAVSSPKASPKVLLRDTKK